MSSIFEHINISRKSQHILFWLAWILSFTFIKSFGYSMPIYFDWLIYYIITLPLFIAHTYIIAYWLVPKYFLIKKYILFSFVLFVLLCIFSVLELILANELIFNLLSSHVIPEEDYMEIKNLIISGIGNHYIVVLFLSVKILKSWYSAENSRNELQLKTVEAEIELLKNQLHPRFLLEVMEELEEMALNKSEQTSEMIIRVSNLMGSILTEQSNDRISLSNELNLIESYIDIQKMVQNKNLISQIIRSGDLESRKIPTLFFFPIVERIMNLVKHADSISDFKIFSRSEKDYLLFIISFYHFQSDPYIKLKTEINKIEQQLNYYYPDNFRVNYLFDKGLSEFTIEIMQQ